MSKHLIVLVILIFCGGCSTIKPQHRLSYVITGGNSQLMRFDEVKDASITRDDPRLKSIVMASKENTTAQIHIIYSTYAGKKLAYKIAKILLEYHANVLSPMKAAIKVNQSFVINEVIVYTHFDSLLKG